MRVTILRASENTNAKADSKAAVSCQEWDMHVFVERMGAGTKINDINLTNKI